MHGVAADFAFIGGRHIVRRFVLADGAAVFGGEGPGDAEDTVCLRLDGLKQLAVSAAKFHGRALCVRLYADVWAAPSFRLTGVAGLAGGSGDAKKRQYRASPKQFHVTTSSPSQILL